MKKLKSLLIGVGVGIFNIGTVLLQGFKPEKCVGNCGACSLSCVQPVVGMLGVGIIVVLFKKFKGRFKKASD